jgi:hypothetical protein
MGDPIVLGDNLPELVEALLRAKHTDDDVVSFSARSEDYEVIWVESLPKQALVEPDPEDWSAALWIALPVKRVTINGEDLPEAFTVKLLRRQRIILILDKDGEVLETSSPITLITPSPI